ncbi:MAG: hypothetical protein A2Z77_00930 [Chloroflexi bacterium RBG_13_51_36]|nr:MAG: hypothetical protein A2Z77_00930 [Chloroflexi bacterium RBG_13_51_36]
MVSYMTPPVNCFLPDMNYGFVVTPWKTSLVWGLTMLGLFIVQLIANLRGHPKNSRQETVVRGQKIRRDWRREVEFIEFIESMETRDC